MKLDWVLIARAAEIQNGEAYLLGAGLDSVEFAEFPASLFCTVVMKVRLDSDELEKQHTISVSLKDPNVAEVVTAEGRFAIGSGQQPDSNALLLAFNLYGVVVERPGDYIVGIATERELLRELSLRVTTAVHD